MDRVHSFIRSVTKRKCCRIVIQLCYKHTILKAHVDLKRSFSSQILTFMYATLHVISDRR
jgi:hypothetical protein